MRISTIETDFEARHYSRPPEPGDTIREFFFGEDGLGLTQGQVATRLGISRQNFNSILNGKRAITPIMAMRLSRVLGLHPQTWLNIQQGVDVYNALHSPEAKRIAKLKRIRIGKRLKSSRAA